jgi:hypothetical protein
MAYMMTRPAPSGRQTRVLRIDISAGPPGGDPDHDLNRRGGNRETAPPANVQYLATTGPTLK